MFCLRNSVLHIFDRLWDVILNWGAKIVSILEQDVSWFFVIVFYSQKQGFFGLTLMHLQKRHFLLKIMLHLSFQACRWVFDQNSIIVSLYPWPVKFRGCFDEFLKTVLIFAARDFLNLPLSKCSHHTLLYSANKSS